jgi:type 1 glutamine amidotransferase
MHRLWLASLTSLVLATALTGAAPAREVKVLIITGDEVSAHKWRETAPFLKELLTKAGDKVDVTESPSRDLTPENLARYDVLLLNYRNTPQGAKANPASVWSDDNKRAFLNAVKGGKGLVVYHFASSAFTEPSALNREFEKAIAGGWRTQGNHGHAHRFPVSVAKDHPITHGLTTFEHGPDELYQNSKTLPGSEVLVTAYSDKSKDPKNTGKNEPVLWVAHYGQGRVCNCVLGHDVPAMQDPGFQTLMIRAVEWTGTGEATYPVPDKLRGGK